MFQWIALSNKIFHSDILKLILFTIIQDIEDIDFTTDNTSLAIKWSGFLHPHQTVAFRACVGSAPKLCDVQFYEVVSASHEKHTFTGLNLLSFRVRIINIFIFGFIKCLYYIFIRHMWFKQFINVLISFVTLPAN